MNDNSVIKVRLIYRNYKPLHKIHESLISSPPSGIEFIVPKPLKHMGFLIKIYRNFGDNAIVGWFIKVFQNTLFVTKKENNDASDILHFINIIAETVPDKPYIVEFEHPLGLANFTSDQNYMNNTVLPFLSHSNCRGIVCMSGAARTTLRKIYNKDYDKIAKKVKVIYPAIDTEKFTDLKAVYTHIKKSKSLNLLFVGNDVYRKGLDETLHALKNINSKFTTNAVQLYVVSKDAQPLLNKYNLTNTHLFKPVYSKEDIIQYFFKPADFFIMPTKLDTFGMVFVDALASSTPVISTTQYAVPEIITNIKDGLLIPYKGLLDVNPLPTRSQTQKVDSPNLDEEMSSEIYKKLEYILNNRLVRSKLSANTQDKFTNKGILSIQQRNKQFKDLYSSAKGDVV